MPPLRLPPSASSLLERVQDHVTDDDDNMLIYGLVDDGYTDLWEFYQIAVGENRGYCPGPEDFEAVAWCFPANIAHRPACTLQHLIDFHCGLHEKRLAGEDTAQRHGLIVMGSLPLQSQTGVTKASQL